MSYTITINSHSPAVEGLVQYLKSLDFVSVTKQKDPTYSEEVLEASIVLKMTPEEIVEAAKEEGMTPEDYAFVMMISKKINRNITKRMCKDFNIPYKS